MIKLIEKSNFDDIEKAVKYYYNKWYYSDMSYDDIASDLKRLGHSDDFIDAVLDGISERYEDEEDYELDEYVERELNYINSMNEEAVKHFHYGKSGESRRREIADRFGLDFTPDDHMITCKDGKVINIQIGKKYRCTSCNNQRVEIVDIDELFDDGSAMLDVAWRNNRYLVASTQIYESVLREKNVEIEVKHEGILEVPDGKNVDDLPFSHFEKLAKKKGLSKITKALNNLQVWNKKKDPKLSKWAGNMIDKLNKKLKKDESFVNENNLGGRDYSYISPVLQEFIDFLEEDGIRVLGVNTKFKHIDVRPKDLEMASWYLHDRDYFGRESDLADWVVASRA
jgi:hypothetical protein